MKLKLTDIALSYDLNLTSGLPAIVFIHGFPFSRKMWRPQMEYLAGKYSTLNLDLRGHGESEVGDGIYTLELFIDDLVALLNHCQLKKVILCGLSLGGYITLRAWERIPDRISGLILCDTKSEADSNEAKVQRARMIELVKSSGLTRYTEEMLPLLLSESTLKHNNAVVKLMQEMMLTSSPRAVCGTLLAIAARTDTTAALKTITVPTLVVVGAEDSRTTPASSKAMASQIPGARLEIISGAGHLSTLERPDEVNQIIGEFLETKFG